MYQASDLRKGLTVEIDGGPYVVTEFNFVKPGKGQALYVCKLKNMDTGATLQRTFRSADKIDEAHLDKRVLTYSYPDGEHFVFVDDKYEQIVLSRETLGDAAKFLLENIEVEFLFHRDKAVQVTLPTFVERQIVECEPGVRGDTATNVMKPAKIQGGHEISVPLFVNNGDIVKIDTRTGEYVDRVRKK